MPNRWRTIGSSSPSDRAQLARAPQIERALHLVGAGLAHVLRRQAVGVLGGIEAAGRVGHLRAGRTAACPRRPRRRTRSPDTWRPRGTRARAAPGRRASSRNAGRATPHPPNSDGSRRRCDRACRRRHRAAASPARCRARRCRRCARAREAGTAARRAAETSARRRTRRVTRSNASRNDAAVRSRARAPGRSAARRVLLDASQLRRQRIGRPLRLCRRSLLQTRPISARMSTNRAAPARLRRKVGAAVKRLEVRRQPDAHRPAARPGRRLHERHVDAIDVGPLLAIDLDRHEVLVQHRGDRVVLERFVLHHVAPVARRVADGQKDRLVLRRAPWRTPRRPRETSRQDCAACCSR